MLTTSFAAECYLARDDKSLNLVGSAVSHFMIPPKTAV
jgi:hypothetical protein